MGEFIIISIVAVFLIAGFIVFLPIFIPMMIYGKIQNYSFKKKFHAYLQSIEGEKIFVYNSRTNSHSYIKQTILPQLPKNVALVYLNGRIPQSKFETKYISHALYSIKDKKGFPYLLKVENGKMIDKSINNTFYNTKNQNKDIQLLLNQINQFYQESEIIE
ncbi:hypothetical protein [Fluviicola taffensis]|uniref:Transmembrane protein n=1 Tax=Fluviicola taffensis (strain DSM 16823 / NCIMB 13979 / RW262) TaxID=755732 RepID=F2IH81_FLUTR|nr:hypothetical protein [Fluviicola taffensis]AEA42636.1 hypothetical protein Fluta_0632 [Fluviicola taffensis DSM 16823]